MKPTCAFILFLLFFSPIVQTYVQCSNQAVFWREADGDGFGDRNFLTDNIVKARQCPKKDF